MKNILVPTDFSDCANDACEYAVELASQFDANVSFLHLQDTPVDWVKLPKSQEGKYPETLHEIGLAKSNLRKLVKMAEDKGVYAEKVLIYSSGSQVVLDHLKSHDYDFMVMGSHGAQGLKERIIGSNAQHMIRQAEVPVLVLKHAVDKALKKVVFASDFSDVSADSFANVLYFANHCGAHLDLLYVDTPGHEKDQSAVDEHMTNIAEAAKEFGGSISMNHIEADSVEQGVINFASENNSDLIAICTHGKSALRQIISPSIAEAIANHSDLPILSIKI